jgi:hypothetical protein
MIFPFRSADEAATAPPKQARKAHFDPSSTPCTFPNATLGIALR